MEHLTFELECGGEAVRRAPPALVGAVGSGNLEVLVEPADLPGRCRIEVRTAAQGFGATWRAVLEDFATQRRPAGLVLSVNDAGATPAVVRLRLDQAVEEYLGGRP